MSGINKLPLAALPDYLRENRLRVTGIRWPRKMGEGVEFEVTEDHRHSEGKEESNERAK